MCKENLYVKMEKLESQICRCTRQGLKVRPCWIPCILLAAYPKYEYYNRVSMHHCFISMCRRSIAWTYDVIRMYQRAEGVNGEVFANERKFYQEGTKIAFIFLCFALLFVQSIDINSYIIIF